MSETSLVPEVMGTAERQSGTMAVQESRAIQEVQAKLVMARKFPRDIARARARILEECKDLDLANESSYKYPRGGEMISGPSIRLAEVLARNWGNMDYGVRELERQHDRSIVQAYCWDLETNVTSDKVFEVPHEIQLSKAKGGKKKRLTDPRDIYELAANNGARRLRAAILAQVPKSIVNAALIECRKTIAHGGGEPIESRVAKMILAFKTLGVSPEMIEEKLQHKLDVITGEEIADLLSIYNSIKDKQAKRQDFFNFPEDTLDEDVESVIEKINQLGGGNE